jgi:hypothetical protein
VGHQCPPNSRCSGARDRDSQMIGVFIARPLIASFGAQVLRLVYFSQKGAPDYERDDVRSNRSGRSCSVA